MNQDTREEWLKKTLLKIKKGKILDAGAGQLKYKDLCKHLEYVSQDFGEYDGVGDSRGLQMGTYDNSKLDIVSDIIDIPVKENSFDAVMCIEVLEHLPYPDKAIKELSRVLKKGGMFILTAPFNSLTHYAPYYFCTGFSRYWYEKVLSDNGFEIIDIQFNGNFFDYLNQEMDRAIYMADKYSKISKVKRYLYSELFRKSCNALGDISKYDSGSSELLCFGIHILAKKIK